MKKICIIIVLIIESVFLFSCRKSITNVDTPFMTVVKLLASEQNLNYDEARKYIDVNLVYSAYPNSIDPAKEWKELLLFNNNLAKDHKFSNSIDFSKYEIEEVINGKNHLFHSKIKTWIVI